MKNRRFQDGAEKAGRKLEPDSPSEERSEKVLQRMEDFFQLRKAHEPARYTMNSEKTLDKIAGQYKGEDARKFISDRLGAGLDNRVRLKGTGESFYLTGSEASGQFLTEEMPGETPEERRETLQLPESNDAEDVYLVHLNQPSVAVESRVAPQEKFAKKAGYVPREGGKQIFVPPKFGDMTPQITVQEQVRGDAPHRSERKDSGAELRGGGGKSEGDGNRQKQ